MLIKQNEVDEHKLCGNRGVRRALKGTTHVSLDDALVHLTEECADVALCIDTLMTVKLVNEVGMQNIGRYKTGRWYGRVCEDGKQ